MAAGVAIQISSEKVEQVAAQIERLNKELTSTLQETRTEMNNLGANYGGEAAEETIKSFNEFAEKYFQSYEDVITQYVTYLRNTVAAGAVIVSKATTALGQQFRD